MLTTERDYTGHMTNFGAGYDAWLEKPYAQAALDAEFAERAVEAYADHHGLDIEDVNEEVAEEWYIDYMSDVEPPERDDYDD